MNSAVDIKRNPAPAARDCNDDECACVVCDKPIKTAGHKFFLWVHNGGSQAVTKAEGERLNASGRQGADLGLQPIGRDCLRKNPELKPFLMTEAK